MTTPNKPFEDYHDGDTELEPSDVGVEKPKYPERPEVDDNVTLGED